MQGDALGVVGLKMPEPLHKTSLVNTAATQDVRDLVDIEVAKDVRDPVGLAAALAVPVLAGLLLVLINVKL